MSARCARHADARRRMLSVIVPLLNEERGLNALLAHLHGGLIPAWEGDDDQTNTVMFGFGPAQDMEDSSKMVAGFDQGGLSLPSRDYYLNDDENSKKIREAYKKHLARMFELAGGDTSEQAAKEAAAVFEIETALAKVQMPAVDRRDPANIYHKRSSEQVKAAMPGPWEYTASPLQALSIRKVPATPSAAAAYSAATRPLQPTNCPVRRGLLPISLIALTGVLSRSGR